MFRTVLRVLILGLCSLRASSAIAESLTRKAATATTTLQAPNEYGTVDYTVTTIPAAAFTYQSNDGYVYGDCACTSYQCACFNGAGPWEFYARREHPGRCGDRLCRPAKLQQGRVSDRCRPLRQRPPRYPGHHRHLLEQCPRLGYRLQRGCDRVSAPRQRAQRAGRARPSSPPATSTRTSPGSKSGGTVRSAPARTATFADVPTDHFFFQYVEALVAAGITAGYGNGLYGVNDPTNKE